MRLYLSSSFRDRDGRSGYGGSVRQPSVAEMEEQFQEACKSTVIEMGDKLRAVLGDEIFSQWVEETFPTSMLWSDMRPLFLAKLAAVELDYAQQNSTVEAVECDPA